MKIKQMMAGMLAGFMVVTSLPISGISNMDVKAANTTGWTWSPYYSQSNRYKLTGLTAVADSEQRTGEESSKRADGSIASGFAANLVDGWAGSYWHSNWSASIEGNPNPAWNADGTVSNTSFTITLQEPKDIVGFTYLPRQDAYGNGPITKLSVQVQSDVDGTFENVDKVTDM